MSTNIIEYQSDVLAGVFIITCPICRAITSLPTSEYSAIIEDSETSPTKKVITIKQTNPKEGSNPYQIDLKEKHSSPNCDFYCVKAPVLILNNSSKTA